MIYFGSTSAVVEELTELLEQKNQKFDLCRIRAYPFSPGLEDFMKEHEAVYVIEQNRDGQMKALLAQAYPQWASKMVSILHFDGTPVTAEGLRHKILNLRGEA